MSALQCRTVQEASHVAMGNVCVCVQSCLFGPQFPGAQMLGVVAIPQNELRPAVLLLTIGATSGFRSQFWEMNGQLSIAFVQRQPCEKLPD